MRTKQLPDDLHDWLKARTVVIGTETALEPNSKRPFGTPAITGGNRTGSHSQSTVASVRRSRSCRSWNRKAEVCAALPC